MDSCCFFHNIEEMNKNFYMQALAGNYPWMRIQASVVAWIYFYKWLCDDKTRLLNIKSLEEAIDYAREQRKFTEFNYIFFMLRYSR
jgi:hypothetical protein